jgi:hypothetical protein
MNVSGTIPVWQQGVRRATVAAALCGLSLPCLAQEASQTQAPASAMTASLGSVPTFEVPTVPPANIPMESSSSSVTEASTLPVAPSALLQQQHEAQKPDIALGTSTAPLQASFLNGPRNSPNMPMERRYTKYIRPGHRGQPLNVREKVDLGLLDASSFGDLGATLISAGYSHIANSQPNYGTDSGAFAARVGAAGIREITEGIFTDSVFSVLEKEDPRYYVMGPQYGYVRRTMYAITRPLLTRTDSGNSTPNGALLSGYAASAALALTYYPSGNRNFHDAASNFGGSIGGAALGFFVSEFQDDFLIALHLKKKP